MEPENVQIHLISATWELIPIQLNLRILKVVSHKISYLQWQLTQPGTIIIQIYPEDPLKLFSELLKYLTLKLFYSGFKTSSHAHILDNQDLKKDSIGGG